MALEETVVEESRIQDVLSYPLLLSDRIRKVVEEADSFRSECSEVGKQVDRLSQMLRSVARFVTSSVNVYERPVRRVVTELIKNLERALTLVRKCKRQSVLRRVVTITNSTDFRKIFAILDSSLGNMRWLLSIFDFDSANCEGIVLTLPPIASNDPIIAWVWSFTASVQMGHLPHRIEAANELASLAQDNDRNKKIIVEEGGVPPLLKFLKENTSAEAQISAANALRNLANDEARVRVIVSELGVPVIVHALASSPMGVQIRVAALIARMAQYDTVAQEEFSGENVIRHLVSLLSFEMFVDEHKNHHLPRSFHSLVQINKGGTEKMVSTAPSTPAAAQHLRSSFHWDGTGTARSQKKENETAEVKLQVKVSCAEALWMLARGSVPNSQRITETKGLLCLAKLIEKEGELQTKCLMTIMEITSAAESNAELRRSAFRTNSPAAKAVVDQLLRLINEEDNPALKIPSIKSIGSLARTFPARETRVIEPLVKQLLHENLDVAAESAISLGKFVRPGNFLRTEHAKSIIEFDGVQAVVQMLRRTDWAQLDAGVLLCYIALHASNNETLEEERVLIAIERFDRAIGAQHTEVKQVVSTAVSHLHLYHRDGAGLPHSSSYPR